METSTATFIFNKVIFQNVCSRLLQKCHSHSSREITLDTREPTLSSRLNINSYGTHVNLRPGRTSSQIYLHGLQSEREKKLREASDWHRAESRPISSSPFFPVSFASYPDVTFRRRRIRPRRFSCKSTVFMTRQ